MLLAVIYSILFFFYHFLACKYVSECWLNFNFACEMNYFFPHFNCWKSYKNKTTKFGYNDMIIEAMLDKFCPCLFCCNNNNNNNKRRRKKLSNWVFYIWWRFESFMRTQIQFFWNYFLTIVVCGDKIGLYPFQAK